jgi:hypothetical protein
MISAHLGLIIKEEAAVVVEPVAEEGNNLNYPLKRKAIA